MSVNCCRLSRAKPRKKKPDVYFKGSDWSVKDLEKAWKHMEVVAKDFGISYYEPQFEIVSDSEMLEIFVYGLPVGYPHWSFGEQYAEAYSKYLDNPTHMAYEVVFNTDPSICYIMGSNTLAEQLLVMAHAAVGHSNVFKNNLLFKDGTDAKNIMNLVTSFRSYILDCERKYGIKNVERIIDCGHALMYSSVDAVSHRMTRDEKEAVEKNNKKTSENDYMFECLLKNTISEERSPERGETNLLKFIIDRSDYLEDWQRNILRTLSFIAQYFDPQRKTKILNEGFATLCEYVILDEMYARGMVDPGIMIEMCADNSGVTYQQGAFYQFESYYGTQNVLEPAVRFNPYALGLNVLRDIKRMCEKPDGQDRELFPNLVGKPYLEEVMNACHMNNDSSFIHQYLGPKVITDMQMAAVFDDHSLDYYVVDYTARDKDYRDLKNVLATQIERAYMPPEITIHEYDKTRRTLTLNHKKRNGITLYQPYSQMTCDMIKYLMNFNSVFIEEAK